MKKIVILLVTSVFLFNLFGYILVYEFLKLQNSISIENKINNGLHEEDLVLLTFPLKSLNSVNSKIKWKEAGKEFFYNKNFYDIVSKTIRNDTVYFYCINDVKEERIVLNYNAAIQKNTSNDSNQRKANLLFSKVNIDYYCQGIHINLFTNISRPILFSYLQIYKSFIADQPSPPPKYSI